MGMETDLIKGIQDHDMEATRQFVERYASPLFRFCRLEFNDHYRAGEFIEEFLGLYIKRLFRGEIASDSVEHMFREAQALCRLNSSNSVPGKGLSKKQRRIIELMDSLPLIDRLILDLVCLEGHSPEDVSGWFGLPVTRVSEIEQSFNDILSSDETIRAFLENAAIQQIKQQKAKDKSEKRGIKKKDEKSIPQKPRRVFSPRELTGPQTLTKWTANDSRTESGKTDGTHRDGSTANAEEHQKPRPRRRRVDPRKLNIEL